ncbi:site-2 protease family protein [Candidatus Saccharibacteria bacterium]|nr:site-2 protease family protein [Candidatus Saccharibacteria bacterium]
MLLIGILTGLFILIFLVVIHELGHGIVARRNGVVVEEFGIGFPPRAWGKKVKQSVLGKNVLISLNWLPLGGFVKLQGEHDSASGKGDYGAATYWQKTKILLAGVLMNWIAAIVLFTILALVGLPKIIPNQFSVPADTVSTVEPLTIGQVENDSPAKKAGLKNGDEILLIGSQEIESAAELSEATKANKGKTVSVTYSRGNQEYTVPVALRDENSAEKGFLGVRTTQRLSEIRATWSAPIVGFVTTVQLTGETFSSLGKLVGSLGEGIGSRFTSDEAARKSGDEALSFASNSVSGPVGILGVIFPQVQQAGIKPLLLLTAIISLSLAVMNVLPIPALDGGRWFTMTIFKLLRKPLTKEREEKIQTVGFMALLGLILVVTIADVSKIIG